MLRMEQIKPREHLTYTQSHLPKSGEYRGFFSLCVGAYYINVALGVCVNTRCRPLQQRGPCSSTARRHCLQLIPLFWEPSWFPHFLFKSSLPNTLGAKPHPTFFISSFRINSQKQNFWVMGNLQCHQQRQRP